MGRRKENIEKEKEKEKVPRSRGKHRRARFVLAVLVLAFLGLSLAQLFSKLPNRSDPSLRLSSATLKVYQEKGDLYFLPKGGENAPIGFVLYPGAKVPKEAYSYLARSVALAGYPAVLVNVPLGYAIFDVGAASRPIAALPGVRAWALAGHSLGGVAASLFAKKHEDIVKGIIYLGSYPPGVGSLAGTSVKALSLVATNDMLATKDKIDNARSRLPESTRYVEIQGGNHAQFGDYGPQRGDGAADITPSRQQSIVVDAVLALLASLQ